MTILLPKAWIQDRKRDYYYQKAKAENYRSRATYKRSQTVRTYRFIRRGNIVVDLGAAPGVGFKLLEKSLGKQVLS